MIQILNKIGRYCSVSSVAGLFAIILYGLYVIWTREDTTMTLIEKRIVITYFVYTGISIALYLLTEMKIMQTKRHF